MRIAARTVMIQRTLRRTSYRRMRMSWMRQDKSIWRDSRRRYRRNPNSYFPVRREVPTPRSTSRHVSSPRMMMPPPLVRETRTLPVTTMMMKTLKRMRPHWKRTPRHWMRITVQWTSTRCSNKCSTICRLVTHNGTNYWFVI
uniref:Uncharacterized protein n=1 Tax=Cacopsylla melanoneura TaxID=428564 RepID=A0A8D8XM91_9HEMI